MSGSDAIYVYGVVPHGTSLDLFAGVSGMDAGPIGLVEADSVAAIASAVPLEEFDSEALEQNLKNAAWLEEKVQAHNRVLAAVVGNATVLPLRFGAIYRGEDQVRAMLSERPELAAQLAHLDGVLEFGVKAVLDPEALRAHLEQSRDIDAGEGSGRAYMLRKRLAHELDEQVRAFAASAAEASHERLVAASVDARANPVQSSDVAGGEMLLNGAYLVPSGHEQELREAVHELQERFGPNGVAYEITGPWPPYNFADVERT